MLDEIDALLLLKLSQLSDTLVILEVLVDQGGLQPANGFLGTTGVDRIDHRTIHFEIQNTTMKRRKFVFGSS